MDYNNPLYNPAYWGVWLDNEQAPKPVCAPPPSSELIVFLVAAVLTIVLVSGLILWISSGEDDGTL